jgi:hypothetical protein
VGDPITCSQSLFRGINVAVTQRAPCTIQCVNAACGGAVMACIRLSKTCRGAGIVCRPHAGADVRSMTRAASNAALGGPHPGSFEGCVATLVGTSELEVRGRSGGEEAAGSAVVGLATSAIVLNVAGTPTDPGTIFALLVQQQGEVASAAAAGEAGDDDPYNDRIR